MKLEEETFEQKLSEKFKESQEIKNIINELYIKNKNLSYLINRLWHTLKKYNLQENTYFEESKIISTKEQTKKDEIFKETIEKLSAYHILGFESLNIIRKKILTKVQKKYSIDETNIKELENLWNINEEDEKILEENRNKRQLNVLNNLIKEEKNFNYDNVDKTTYLNVKTEIKKYEKELDLKSAQNLENKINSNINNNGIYNNNGMDVDNSDNENDDDDNKIKISESFKKFENENFIDNFKKNINDNLIKESKNFIEKEKIFNSQILNDLYEKLNIYGKLSDFDIQIVLYITHFMNNELINAKNNKRNYKSNINPQEIIKFLKIFKKDNNINNNNININNISNINNINNNNNNNNDNENVNLNKNNINNNNISKTIENKLFIDSNINNLSNVKEKEEFIGFNNKNEI